LKFHKEKEMVAFRKLFPVLAVFALLLSAQSVFAQGQPLQCLVNTGVPPVVRAEGFTELVGDILITCTRGDNVAPFLANFQVFLNTNVTSRLVSGDLSEALLMIDEPGTAGNPNFCLSPNAASNGASPQTVADPASNLSVVATAAGRLPFVGAAQGATAPTGPCANFVAPGADGSVPLQTATYNVFRASRATDITGGSRENSLVWPNVPVVPPGSAGTRTFRITNIRANASGVGPGGLGLPGQIVAFLSVFPPGTLPLNNPQQIVGYVQPGMAFDLRNCANTDSSSIGIDQCGTGNTGAQRTLFDNPAADEELPALASFRFREGFQTAFKPRIVTGQDNALPGSVFVSESGFVRSSVFGVGNVGEATNGTRLAVRFSNVPANLRVFVSTTNAWIAGNTIPAGRAVYVSTDVNGAGGATSLVPTQLPIPTSYVGPSIGCTGLEDAPAVEVPIVNGTGLAVWEIISTGNAQTDTALNGLNEELWFPYGVAYRFAAGSNQVGLGTGTVIGNLAPFYTSANTMSQILPVPRFIASTASPINALRVQACQTNLLFPYVTNWAGFDTGMAIANTSDDMFSDPQNRRQAGRCRLNYFGRLPNGNAPTTVREETDREVAAGETITLVLSSGGGLGLRGNANFQGYIIAQCDFRFAHGFAFITDGPIGQARVAEGYLALVLDGGTDTSMRLRGQSTGENRAH
jgi:hypothetical protein